MQNIAIIVEYNPMHNGHVYQIKKIKELYPESSITVIMSGTVVQRGEFSVLNKFHKAEIAINNGVDLVIEMPSIVSLQSADNFAFFNVKILDMLKIFDYIAFGVEAITPKQFYDIYNFYYNHKETIFNKSKEYIDEGLSYKVSFNKVIKEIALENNISDYELLTHPNNTLAIKYLDALNQLNSSISPLPIIREDSGYHSLELDDSEFQSATTIRNLLQSKQDFSKYVPIDTFNSLNQSINVEIDILSSIFKYLVVVAEKSADEITGYENGLENLIINNFESNLTQTINKIHNKRYSKSRISRFILNYVLNITNNDIKNLDYINYIRPLRFNDTGASLLRQVKEMEEIIVLTKLTESYNLDDINKAIIEFDKKAYYLQNSQNEELLTLDYRNNPKM